MVFQTQIQVSTDGQGLYHITEGVKRALKGDLPGVGVVNVFLQHTSASLVIQENADQTAQADLEEFIERIVPRDQDWHRHTLEGPDDTTSHMKSSITATSLQVPVVDGALALGKWQGIYLWEHRDQHHIRNIILTVVG